MLLPRAVPAQEEETEAPVHIGVLAYRGWDDSQGVWAPLAEYLSDGLGGRPVEMIPVTLASAALLIETGALDFLITNPGHYLTLARNYPMSVIATRARRLSDGSLSTSFGSAVIARRGTGLASLAALRGARLAAVSPRGFGGFQTVWYEAQEQGIDLRSAPSEILYLGFPMDRVVEAVLAGEADFGIVRSGLIERMTVEGRIPPGALEVLDPGAGFTHADAVSTRLYPEWPFLALSRTDPQLCNDVALALLQTVYSSLSDVWRAPVSYLAVERLLAAYEAGTLPAEKPRLRVPLAVWAALALTALALAGALLWLRRAAAPLPPPGTGDAPEVDLTRRERQILELVSRGLSSKEIAADLGVSPKTVEFHRSNLLRKFDVRSAAQLVSVAGDLLRRNGETSRT